MAKKKQNQSENVQTSEEELAKRLEKNRHDLSFTYTQTGGEGFQLTPKQLQEFTDESTAIYKSKTLAKALPLIQKFLYKWRYYFLKPPYDPMDDKGSARFYKIFLTDLATKEKLPLTIHIDNYPDSYLGIQQLADDLMKALPKKERKNKFQKIAIIAKYLKANPGAESTEISTATGIDASDVRHLWPDIKKALKENRRTKPYGYKSKGKTEGISENSICKCCGAPLSDSFYCETCKETIKGACKECHYDDDKHRDDPYNYKQLTKP
jgi:hypothetical protein